MKSCSIALVMMAILLFVSLALAQQGGLPAAKKENPAYAEIAKAPDKARAKRNPFENESDAVLAGRNLFEQHCAECHADGAQGGKKAPSLRAPEIQEASPGAIFWVLTNGVVRRGMPVWSKLPEPQRWQLVSYIKSLRTISADPSADPANNAAVAKPVPK